jgi:hypothetical protein
MMGIRKSNEKKEVFVQIGNAHWELWTLWKLFGNLETF